MSVNPDHYKKENAFVKSYHLQIQIQEQTIIMAKSRKIKILTPEQRIDVLEKHDKGQSCRAIAAQLNVGKTQIQSIIKDKDNLLKMWKTGSCSADSKFFKNRKTTYDEIDNRMWDWFCQARAKNIPITGPLLQQEALMLSVKLGDCDNFTASNGWLQSFLKRHNIKSSILSGEAADVSEDVLEDWTKRLPTILEGYERKDIFNADETGLFFRTLPNKSYVVKGDKCSSGKNSKERLTVLLACSAAGEKLKPLVIGKSENPRCFRGHKPSSLPVTYKWNKKAWMTSEIFREWINILNNKMRIQKRKILLLIDNCAAHPPVQASNVKLVFLPPNTTSRLQPCDAGIIRCFKAHYRKRLLRHILLRMDEVNKASDLAKQVSVIDSIIWTSAAWEAVTPETIQKCFLKCGIGKDSDTDSNDSDTMTEDLDLTPDDDIQPLLEGTSWEDFANCDNNIQTFPTDTPTDHTTDMTEDEPDDDTTPEADPTNNTKITVQHALKCLQDLQHFALQHGSLDLLKLTDQSTDLVEKTKWENITNSKQSTIENFFK